MQARSAVSWPSLPGVGSAAGAKLSLLGSSAYGQPRPDSDVDVPVVLPFGRRGFHKSLEILNRVSPDFPLTSWCSNPKTQLAFILKATPWFAKPSTTDRSFLIATVSEWVAKAEGNYRTADREHHASVYPASTAYAFMLISALRS